MRSWVGPLHVLWGRGLANGVLLITSCVAASALLLNFLLIPRFEALQARHSRLQYRPRSGPFSR